MKTEIESANIKEINEYLSKKDKYLKEFIKIAPEFNLKINSLTSVYQALIESIISQQISSKAAYTIFKRLCSLFNTKNIRPLDIIRTEDEELKSIGISRPKISYIRNLTDYEISGKLPTLKTLNQMKSEEIVHNLTQIKGIGKWTVEMLLIFRLGRLDIISSNDLGLRKGFAIISHNYPIIPSPEELFNYSEKYWKPYRSVASWYLWRACEGI